MHDTTLHYGAQLYVVLHYTTVHCAMSYYTALYYTTLHCTVLYCITLHYAALYLYGTRMRCDDTALNYILVSYQEANVNLH